METKLNEHRLRLLVAHLRTPEVADHWSYSRIIKSDNGELGHCGTSGCALGHATNIRELGLRPFFATKFGPTCGVYGVTDRDPNIFDVNARYPFDESLDAAMRVFGLNARQATRIFADADRELGIKLKDVTPAKVADLIERVIAESR